MKTIIHKILYPENSTDYMVGTIKNYCPIVLHCIYEWELRITKN